MFQLLHFKKLNLHDHVLRAARHNRREIQAERGADGHIDARRCHLNRTLAGPAGATAVADLAKGLMKQAGIRKLRKDAVLAVELVISLPQSYPFDPMPFFQTCLAWAEQHFGGPQNILSADVHLDESAPHMHILILPLVNGRMNGSDMVGGKAKLAATKLGFHEEVGQRFGLQIAPPKLQASKRRDCAKRVVDCITKRCDPIRKSALWNLVTQQIAKDPLPYAAQLGISAADPSPRPVKAAKPKRSFTDIMTSAGRGPKSRTEAARRDAKLNDDRDW